jgi:hypothetical protein
MRISLAAASLAVLAVAAPRPVQGAVQPREVEIVIEKFQEKDADMAKVFADAWGYAVYPNVGKGGMGIGGARGKGLVYEHGALIGRSTLTQLTIGL